VLAHQGLVPRDSPEIAPNTLAAFAAAQAAGVEFIETDCHLSADGTVVLFHDDTVESVAGDPRRVAELGVVELERLLAPHGGLVTLEQALETFPGVRFNVDVKAADAAVAAGRIAAEHADRVLLTSFADERRLAALAAAAPARPATSAGRETLLRFLLAVTAGARRVARRALRDIDALQVPERQGPIRIVTPRFIRFAHDAGCEVHVWTVNDVADMRRLLAMGVDGIVTDRADDALAALA